MSDNHDLRSIGVQFGASLDKGLAAMEFPFKCTLSLSPLVAFWDQAAASSHPAKAALAKQIQDEVRQAPELLESIEDLSLIERHQGLVDLLMSAVFPPASWDHDYAAATIPPTASSPIPVQVIGSLYGLNESRLRTTPVQISSIASIQCESVTGFAAHRSSRHGNSVTVARMWRDWAVVVVTRPLEERGVEVNKKNNGGAAYLMRKVGTEWRLLSVVRSWGS